MAHALLVSTASDDCARITRSAARDTFKIHSTTDDPDAADVIIFFEPDDPYLASDVRNHPYAKRFPEKTFLFDPSDRIVPFLPGIYASVQRRQYDHSRVRSGFFPVVFDHDWITDDAAATPELLFSFIGDMQGHPVRKAIGALRHPRALILDTSKDPANADGHPAAFYERFHRDFAEVMRNSRFILCPRGAGVSTFRLFETMKAGRVPVIVSDDWVAPEGPTWPSFSITVSEREVATVPEVLEARERDAAAMGRIARQEWDLWFSESVSFHRIVESCLSLRQSRRWPERLMRVAVLWQLLEPFNFRYKLVPGLRGLARHARR